MAREAPPRSAPRPDTEVRVTPRRRGRLVLALLVLVCLAGALLLKRSSSAAPEVPDPVTDEMLAPVRRALADARAAAVAAPDSAATWGQLAMLCDAHHLYPVAERCYRAARARAPDDFRWSYGLAVVRDFMGAEAEEVAGLFDAAIALEPRYPPARLRHGDALVRQGDLAAAQAAYEQALALDPDFGMAHRNLGQTLLARDDVSGAITHLERAASLDPADGVVQSSLAQAYWRAGDAARSQRASEAAQAMTPVYGVPDPVRYAIDGLSLAPLACDRRAREHEHRGEWSAALPDLERLAEMTPDDAAVHARLGRALRNTGELERASVALARALELRPEHVLALAERARVHQARGELRPAVELYRKALALAPQDATAWKELGACLGELDDLPGALVAFESAGRILAADAELLHNWGMVLCRAGHQREACERLRSALALAPGNGGTHYVLAAALETLGQREEAIQHYERALVLDPALPSAERLAVLREGR